MNELHKEKKNIINDEKHKYYISLLDNQKTNLLTNVPRISFILTPLLFYPPPQSPEHWLGVKSGVGIRRSLGEDG